MTAAIRISQSRRFAILFLALLSLVLFPCSYRDCPAADADTLAQEAATLVRNAERNMFSGKNEEAMKLLDEAAAAIEQLKAADPQNKKLRSLENKYDKTRKAVEKKLATPSSSPGQKPDAANSSAAGGSDKLPGGVSKRLRDIARDLDNAEKMADRGMIDNAKLKLAAASDLFTEINTMYGGKFSPEHPDYVAAKERFAVVEKTVGGAAQQKAAEKAGAEQAEQAMQAQSDAWVKRFMPYIANEAREGHDPNRYLVFPGTSQPEQMKKMQNVYEDLKKLYAEYQNASFPDGKTGQLEQAENEVKFALQGFSESYAGGTQSIENDAERALDQAITMLEGDTKWKTDSEALPPIVDTRQKESISSLVAQVENIHEAGDPVLVTIKEKQAKMLSLDQEHRRVRAERTFIRPEAYKGKDLKELRRMAESIIQKEKPGAKILRVSVYQDAWKEERVLEPTDSTNTAIRYRVTRMINAQVAVKDKGKVTLNTLHIAQDQKGNGWGKLYGHIMYTDPMVEANVKK